MNIVICDDNPNDQEQTKKSVERYLLKYGFSSQITLLHTGQEVIDYQEPIDVLLLDIDLAEASDTTSYRDGIDVMRTVVNRHSIWRIIFVSAHNERVFDSFSLKTLGFVVKPVQDERMEHFLNIAFQELKQNRVLEVPLVDSNHKVTIEEIVFVTAERNYCILHTQERPIKVAINVTNLLKVLPEELFVRIHKSYVVNLMHVDRISGECQFVNQKETLPVGRKYLQEAKEKCMTYIQNKVRQRMG